MLFAYINDSFDSGAITFNQSDFLKRFGNQLIPGLRSIIAREQVIYGNIAIKLARIIKLYPIVKDFNDAMATITIITMNNHINDNFTDCFDW